MARKPTVYPELIKPGAWQVEEWRPDGKGSPCPCTDTAGRRMLVPAGHGPFAREVKFHEMLHVKYSPEVVPSEAECGATTMSVLAAEDARINLLGARIRPHDAARYTPTADAFTLAQRMTVRAMAQVATACVGFATWEQHLEKLRADFLNLYRMETLPMWLRDHAANLYRAIGQVKREAPAFIERYSRRWEGTLALARWLDKFDDGSPQPPPEPRDKGGEGDEDGESEYGEKPDTTDGTPGWGTMEIETPPLTVRHRVAGGRRFTPSATGVAPRNWGRLVTGQVFSRPAKSRTTPDAVLIDQSGSMHWDSAKLHELVGRMPVGVIAGYCGDGGRGVLKILARDGRMVEESEVEPYTAGNEIDGPALRWLAKQKGRKVWVSDQAVCSSRSHDDGALLRDCNSIRAAAGIKVCLSTEPRDIMATLRGKK